ncbi:MAG: hypothetical protein Q4F67_00425 [Propionibacteriaceae bacterium]|nr:hypothetical protein [Propionibacteriaceae bacterium]
MRQLHVLFGLVLALGAPLQRSRDERGLSQSTENAILLAGAVAVATLVITVITTFVRSRLPQ